MENKLLDAVNEMQHRDFSTLEQALQKFSPREIFEEWLHFEGIIGCTDSILGALDALFARHRKGRWLFVSRYTRLATPIRVGECYRNGMSCYQVLEAMPSIGEALLCRPSDGWTLLAHGAALYDTDEGEQLIWDYSTRENKANV